MSYWRHVVPLLIPYYTVVAVDNCGFGGSRPSMTQCHELSGELGAAVAGPWAGVRLDRRDAAG
jgi:hypothetical protein